MHIDNLKSILVDESQFAELLDTKTITFTKEVKNIPNEVLNLRLALKDYSSSLEGENSTTREIGYKIEYTLPCKFWHFRSQFGIMLKKELTATYAKNEVLYIKEPFFMQEDGNIVYEYSGNKINTKFKSARYMSPLQARYFIKIIAVKLNKINDFYMKQKEEEEANGKKVLFEEKEAKYNADRYSHKYEVEYQCELIKSPSIQKSIKEETTIKYFYRIKAPQLKGEFEFGDDWNFKVFDIGYIEAKSKKEAREKIEEDYNSKMCMKSKKADIGNKNLFLLNLYEPDAHWDEFWNGERECSVCNQNFVKIQRDKLYDFKSIRSGYCCPDCEEVGEHERYRNSEEDRLLRLASEDKGIHQPCIYKITNKNTNMCYIGQTSQAFTFRWYQHFIVSTNSSTKFYDAISESSVTDWIFEVIEVISDKQRVDYITECREKGGSGFENKYINTREQYWINQFDSIRNGYNSGVASKELHAIHTKYSDGLFELSEICDDSRSKQI